MHETHAFFGREKMNGGLAVRAQRRGADMPLAEKEEPPKPELKLMFRWPDMPSVWLSLSLPTLPESVG